MSVQDFTYKSYVARSEIYILILWCQAKGLHTSPLVPNQEEKQTIQSQVGVINTNPMVPGWMSIDKAYKIRSEVCDAMPEVCMHVHCSVQGSTYRHHETRYGVFIYCTSMLVPRIASKDGARVIFLELRQYWNKNP